MQIIVLSAEHIIIWNKFLNKKEEIPRCDKCSGVIKPYVTLYEEELDMTTFNSRN